MSFNQFLEGTHLSIILQTVRFFHLYSDTPAAIFMS